MPISITSETGTITVTTGSLFEALQTLDDKIVAERSATATLTNKSLTSPTLTGIPTAPTAAAGTNTTQIATTAFVEATRDDFPTRAALIAARPTLTLPVGSTVTAGGWSYRVEPLVYVGIPDAPGLSPMGDPTPYHFGAVGDGVTNDRTAIANWWAYLDSFAGSYGDQHAPVGMPEGYVPSGFFLCSTGLVLSSVKTGFGVRGDGFVSRLENVQITAKGNRQNYRNFQLSGALTDHGILVDGDANTVRSCLFSGLLVRDKAVSCIKITNLNAGCFFSDCFTERGPQGWDLDQTLGCQINNCRAGAHTGDGVREVAAEFKINGFTSLGNENRGWVIVDDTDASPRNSIENYRTDVTITDNQSNLANRDTNAITAAADNGAGGTTLTIGAHRLSEGIGNCIVDGTTSYDGTYTVFNVTNTTVDIDVAFVADETGTLIAPGWDLWIEASVEGAVNDMFFVGGNINHTYIKNGFNIGFVGTRRKERIWLDGGCRAISGIGPTRGRAGTNFDDVYPTGQNFGWSVIGHTIPGATSATSGPGGAAMTAPDNSTALTGNKPALNIIRAMEDRISLLYEDTETLRIDTAGRVWLGAGNGIGNISRKSGSLTAAGNYLDFVAQASPGTPQVLAQGVDTNVGLLLTPKGAGVGNLAGNLRASTVGVGFYGTNPVAKQTITGSKGGNAALADLLTKLAAIGLITDSTT